MTTLLIWNRHRNKYETLYRPCPGCRAYNITLLGGGRRLCFACGYKESAHGTVTTIAAA